MNILSSSVLQDLANQNFEFSGSLKTILESLSFDQLSYSNQKSHPIVGSTSLGTSTYYAIYYTLYYGWQLLLYSNASVFFYIPYFFIFVYQFLSSAYTLIFGNVSISTNPKYLLDTMFYGYELLFLPFHFICGLLFGSVEAVLGLFLLFIYVIFTIYYSV